MSKPMRLRYHQRTFELLGEIPIVSRTNVRLIEEWEQKHNVRLPAAIREWYSLQGAEKRGALGRIGYSTRRSIREILKEQSVSKRGNKVVPPNHFSVGDIGDNGIATTVARFDGTEDPTVMLWLDHDEMDPIYGRGRVKFSDFVFFTLWDLLIGTAEERNKPFLQTKDAALGPIEFDFLLEHMNLFFRERRHHGKREMRSPFDRDKIIKLFPYRFAFRHPSGFLLIHCQANPTKDNTEAIWHLLGNNDGELFEMANLLWGCGDFSKTLTAGSEAAKAVLKRLRRHYGSGE